MADAASHRSVARVAFNMRPADGPWGGSSAFVEQLGQFLRARGYDVCYSLREPVDLIIIVDPRHDLQNKAFGMDDIRDYRKSHPAVRVMHRVNECDLRKNSNFMDALLAGANPAADFTVFISRWLLDHHAERWFDKSLPHAVVYNGADPRIFHPIGTTPYTGRGPFRLVTHHWADSRIKGFDAYEKVDRMIADGHLKDTQLVVIGRWPADIRWSAAELHPPACGVELARQLRGCHAYITASKWEPCGMHHVEGAQCGLPLIYHEDGGGINEAGEKYGIAFRDDVAGAIALMQRDYLQKRRQLLADIPSGDLMCLEYARIIQRLLSGDLQ